MPPEDSHFVRFLQPELVQQQQVKVLNHEAGLADPRQVFVELVKEVVVGLRTFRVVSESWLFK